MDLVAKISQQLNISPAILAGELKAARKHIKILKISKRSGGQRKVYIAPKAYKLVQYYLLQNYLERLHIHKCATAFYKGASIRSNAERHRKKRYLIKIDILDFFPSLTFHDFMLSIDYEFKDSEFFGLIQSEINRGLIRETCFSEEGRLCAGYPISPYIANITMKMLDNAIEDYLVERFGASPAYSFSRYADDIVIGFDEKNVGREIIRAISHKIETFANPRLMINQKKTRLYNRNVGNAVITGLRICRDERITLTRPIKDHIRLLLSLYEKGQLKVEEHSSLLGYLNFCRDADPAFYTKLVHRNFKAVQKLKSDY